MKRQKRNKLFIILALLLCAAIGTTWWAFGRNGEAKKASAPSTAKVIRRDFSSSVLATGAVKPQVGAEVRVGSRISGKVDHLYANIGDFVKKGQIIAELEHDDLAATVDQRQAELQVAEAKFSAVKTLGPKEIEKAETEVAQWQATKILTKKDLNRQEDLLKKDFTSQQSRDQAQEQLSVAEARLTSVLKALDLVKAQYREDLKQERADVERAKAALVNAKVKLSYATITAPISGVVGSVSTQEGETVAAGLNSPTFVTIIDLKRLQVDAYVDEVDIGKVKVGQRAVFTVDAFPAKEFEGRIVAIYPDAVIQENVVNYDVVVDITTPYEGLLRPEMTASITILLKARTGVLAVPVEAIKREQGKTRVYVLKNGRAAPREVKTGWKDGQWIEIVRGVEEGQTVLLSDSGRAQKKNGGK